MCVGGAGDVSAARRLEDAGGARRGASGRVRGPDPARGHTAGLRYLAAGISDQCVTNLQQLTFGNKIWNIWK